MIAGCGLLPQQSVPLDELVGYKSYQGPICSADVRRSYSTDCKEVKTIVPVRTINTTVNPEASPGYYLDLDEDGHMTVVDIRLYDISALQLHWFLLQGLDKQQGD